jgi:hypothetical protein
MYHVNPETLVSHRTLLCAAGVDRLPGGVPVMIIIYIISNCYATAAWLSGFCCSMAVMAWNL